MITFGRNGRSRSPESATLKKPHVFAPPIATFAGAQRARERDLANGLALTVEADKSPANARNILEAVLERATVVVASGGVWTDPATGEAQNKLHLHWRLRVPTRDRTGHALLKEARKLATKLVGGDPTNTPICHPIRWPGSVHRKGEPKLCQIVEIDPTREIELEEAVMRLRAAMPADPEPEPEAEPTAGAAGPGAAHTADADRDTAELVRRMLTGEEYHSTLRDLAWRYLMAGMAPPQVVMTLRGMMDAAPEDKRDARWQHRRDQIAKLVSTAQAKLEEEEREEAETALSDQPRFELTDACFYGPAGDFVRAVEPETESSPMALLSQFMTGFGVLVGRGPYYQVEDTQHRANENMLLIGRTSRGRKGTAKDRIVHFFELVLPGFRVDVLIEDGMSSGEVYAALAKSLTCSGRTVRPGRRKDASPG